MRWNFDYFTFSQERWNFPTDVLNLCWNFARNALKFFCFHVFSKMFKLFNRSAECALKLCEKCAEKSAEFFSSRLVLKMRWNYIVLRFLKSADVSLRMWWICAETLQEMHSSFFVFTFFQKCLNFSTDLLNVRWNFVRNAPKKALNFFLQDLYSKCAEIISFYAFSRALQFFYGCAEFGLKLCKKWAKISFFYVFSKALKLFLRMCWICAETLQMCWDFIVSTFSQKCWNFSTDVLKLRWNFVRMALLYYVFSKTLKFFNWCAEFVLKLCKECAEILLFLRFLKSAKLFLRMCWICVETL